MTGYGLTSPRMRERLIEELEQQGITSLEVLDAIRTVPRHEFVEEALWHRAYDNDALPIGHGQTISQPYIVARMTEALLGGRHALGRVLEIGTGSGYQAAILSRVAREVFSIERIDALHQLARQRFQHLGIRNVRLKLDDGRVGWPDFAPYDGILVTAAPPGVPRALAQQLKEGGRLIVPVGKQGTTQELVEVRREGDEFPSRVLEAVRFVPLRAGTQ